MHRGRARNCAARRAERARTGSRECGRLETGRGIGWRASALGRGPPVLAALPRVPSHLGMVPVHTCFRRPRGGLQLYGGPEHGQGKSRLLPMMVCFSAGVRHQQRGARIAQLLLATRGLTSVRLCGVQTRCSRLFGCGVRSTSTTSSCPLPSTAPGPRGTRTSTTARGKRQ